MFRNWILPIVAILAGLGGHAMAQTAGFAAPSGNILCYLDPYDYGTGQELAPQAQPLVCVVFEANWTLPPDYGDGGPGCDMERTRTLILPPYGPVHAQWTCHGDVFWPMSLATIGYGSNWAVMGYGCTMRRDGVHCQNASGNGFAVRRAALELY